MKKELLSALIASDYLINQKIEYIQTRLDENYKLLQGLNDEEEIKEDIEDRIEFYSDLIATYEKHLKTIRDYMDKKKN